MGSGRVCLLAVALAATTGCAVGATGDLPDGSLGGTDVTVGSSSGTADARDVTSIFGDTGAPADTGPVDAGSDAAPGDGAPPDAEVSDAPAASESGPGDAAVTHDAGHDVSVTCPVGMAGPGCAGCATGYHLCGATCSINGANDPATGCAEACGNGACASSPSETAYCTDAGVCAVMSSGCPSGEMMCAGGCAACCTATDCPSGDTCTGGTCQPGSTTCPPNFGTCVTACDTDFSQPGNCGGCGVNCNDCSVCNDGPFGVCPIPFIGGTGCDCEGDGTDADSYSCF